ncbi:MAG: ATP-dependent helicase, partial [Alphaproteobacteria bacterium]|nr:ATP-dependent helicase [Alphaproteobacteria bacterium]
SLVINYELPIEKENYIHRIGRSGRFGRKGTAINLLCNEDVSDMEDIKRVFKIEMQGLPQDLSEIKLS